jgi:uncharacterized protein YndB with AHSA1/START domain
VTSKVVVALRVAAAPERCFDAFTADIGAWWRPNALFQTTPRAPGVLSFEGRERLIETLAGGKVFEIGKVKVWDRPSRLVFSWRQVTFPPDLNTEVEVTFTAAGDETRIAVAHSGFERVPQDNAARHTMPDAVLLKHLGEWWREQLQSLDDRL